MSGPLRSPIRWRRSLAARLLAVTTGVVLTTELLVFVPALTAARREWLGRRINEAQIAGVSAAPWLDGSPATEPTRDDFLRRSGIDAIRIDNPGRSRVVLPPASAPPTSSSPLDLTGETLPIATIRAFGALLGAGDKRLEISAASALDPGARITLQLRSQELTNRLRHFAVVFGISSLAEATVVGLLVYVVLLALLVRPMRHIIGSIRAFRADPERTPPLVAETTMPLRNDEMAAAARELYAMQRELRTALWRNARLAAIGVAVSKVSHDLRGALSPALLAAERLQSSADPGVARSGDILVRTVDRATELMRATLEFAREVPATPERTRVPLRSVMREAAEQVQAATAAPPLEFAFGDEIEIEADRTHLVRVFANLLRNAAEAGARTVRVSVETMRGEIAVCVADDGAGLPDAVREKLFRPFVSARNGGTGLGLAIVRDLLLANRGDVTLVSSGPHGTAFRLTLPAASAVYRPSPLPSNAA